MANKDAKTVATEGDVGAFLAGIADGQRRADAHRLVELLAEATGQPPVMWGTSIVGFGSRHYRYDSGREGDSAAVGFSPRKGQTTVYLTGYVDQYQDLLTELGAHSTGKGCLYLKRVDDVDGDVLSQIAVRSQRLAAADG